MKEDIHSFHMRHSRLICSKRLHQNQAIIRNTKSPLVRNGNFAREMHIQSLKYPTFLISQVNIKNILLDNFYCISEVLLSYLSNFSPTLTLQHWNPLRSRWSDEISDEGGVDSGCSSSLRPPRRPPRRKIRPRQRPSSLSSAFWGGIHRP